MRLVINIDMLNDFCDDKGALARSIITDEFYAQPIIPAMKAIINNARSSGDAIIWLGDWHDPEDEEFDRFPPHAVMNTWGAEIIPELNPKLIESSPHEMKINKNRFSGFFGTELEFKLSQISPDEIVVMGVCTSICVMDTVGGLANRDYKNIKVPRALVADFDPKAHDFALTRMENIYGAEII